jgi:hypothetical protein
LIASGVFAIPGSKQRHDTLVRRFTGVGVDALMDLRSNGKIKREKEC